MTKTIENIHVTAIVRNIQKRTLLAKESMEYANTVVNAIKNAIKNNSSEVKINSDEWSYTVYKKEQFEEVLSTFKDSGEKFKDNYTRYIKDLENIKDGKKISQKTKQLLKNKYQSLLDNEINNINVFTDELNGIKSKYEQGEIDCNGWIKYKSVSIKDTYYDRFIEKHTEYISKSKDSVVVLTDKLSALKSM